jgi:hypothetical protein
VAKTTRQRRQRSKKQFASAAQPVLDSGGREIYLGAMSGSHALDGVVVRCLQCRQCRHQAGLSRHSLSRFGLNFHETPALPRINSRIANANGLHRHSAKQLPKWAGGRCKPTSPGIATGTAFLVPAGFCEAILRPVLRTEIQRDKAFGR